MRDYDDSPLRLYRGPGWFSVLVISLLTSCASVLGYHYALTHGLLPGGMQSAGPEPEKPAATAADAQPNSTAVPLLAGFPLQAAMDLARERELKLVVKERKAHDELPADAVIDQDPLANAVVLPGSTVQVTLSTGPGVPVKVPDLTGKTAAEATALLEAAGLKAVVGEAPDAGGSVVSSTEPPAGGDVAPGAEVRVTLGVETREVPKLVGLNFRKAKKAIEENGFVLGKLRERFDEFNPGWIILSQTPKPGEQAPVGSAIDVLRNEAD